MTETTQSTETPTAPAVQSRTIRETVEAAVSAQKGQGGGSEADPSREAFDKITGTKGAEKAQEPAQTAQEADTGSPGSKTKPAEKATEDPREGATKALRLAGYPQAAIDAADDATLAQWAEESKERERGRNQTLEERASRIKELEDRLDGHRQPKDEGKATETAEPSSDVPTAGPDLAKAFETLTETLGKDESAALEALIRPLIEHMDTQAAELKQLRGSVQTQEQRAASESQRKLAAVREKLGERFPGLSDADTWDRVGRKMTALATDPDYGSIDNMEEALTRLITDAAKVLDLESVDPDQAKAAEQQQAAERETRARSQPTASTTKRSAPKNLTPGQRDRAIFDKIMKQSERDKL